MWCSFWVLALQMTSSPEINAPHGILSDPLVATLWYECENIEKIL